MEENSNNCVCLKPLPESSSADVIFMKRVFNPTVGQKRSLDDVAVSKPGLDLSIQTITVGLAVKNYSTTQFGLRDLEDECIKFKLMFQNLSSSTVEALDSMTNVLVVCATNYCLALRNSFKGKDFVKRPNNHGLEILLLDLSTPANRTAFFGLNDDPNLAAVMNGLINKTERERMSDEG